MSILLSHVKAMAVDADTVPFALLFGKLTTKMIIQVFTIINSFCFVL